MELKQLADPTEIIPGSQEVDEEILKILFNINQISEMIYGGQKELTGLKGEYHQKYLSSVDSLTPAALKALGLSTNSKRPHIEELIYDPYGKTVEEVKNKIRYLERRREDMQEMINVYKKLRSFENK